MIHAAMRQNAATSSDIKRSGGLSIGQKMLANLSLDAQTQANIANAMLKVDTQNQEWQRLAADAEVKAFMDRAKLEMQGRQQDRTNAAAAHNAKQQGMQTGIYNIQNAVEQYFANEFKRKQFDANMKLYQEDVAYKKAYYDWLRNNKWSSKNVSLRNSVKNIDNNGLYGVRLTPDTLDTRHELYRRYQVDPFTRAMEKLRRNFNFY
jgi:hypothetical protein